LFHRSLIVLKEINPVVADVKFRKINLVALCFADRGFGVIKPVKRRNSTAKSRSNY